jgi:hypothetical protein
VKRFYDSLQQQQLALHSGFIVKESIGMVAQDIEYGFSSGEPKVTPPLIFFNSSLLKV